MKRITLYVSLFLALALPTLSHAQINDTGNPVGSVDTSSTCALVTGWSYDPDFNPAVIRGCTNMSATNYNKNANTDDGSCTFPEEPCVSRYRWVNITAGAVSHAQACSSVGAVPIDKIIPERGYCASGESRPKSGYNVAQINYSRGVWGGGNGGGGTIMPNQGGYRCYIPGQKQDRDNTDVTVAYYCDFGEQYAESCPADTPPPRTFTGGGSVERDDIRRVLNFNPGTLLKMLSGFLKPFSALAASSDSNSVLIYEGDENTGILRATVPANILRPDVNLAMGITGNHGFSWSVPAELADGTSRTFRFYGTDIDVAGRTNELSRSPLTLTCSGGNGGNATPSTPSLNCPASGSVTGAPVAISFLATDADNDGVRYLIDWDASGSNDQTVPAAGFAPSGETQSASRTWSTAGQKTVRVTAQDAQGNMSSYATCSISVSEATSCTENCDGNGGDTGGTDNGGDTGAPTSQPGFTVTGNAKAAIQFVANLSATSETVRVGVNSVSGFNAPVTLRVASIVSATGASLASNVTPTYYWNGVEGSSIQMTYNSSFGEYVNPSGTIGTTFAIKLSSKVEGKHYITVVGESGSKSSEFVIELDPKAVNPDFREI